MAQASFAELEHDLKKRRTRRELFLEKMDKLVPWERLERRLEPFYPKAGRGRRPYPLSVMLRVHCVQLFYNLSDPEMHQTKKGKQWYFGMKAHIGVDAGSGLAHSLTTTAANASDVTQAGTLLHGAETTAWGDAGYQGVEKRPEHRDGGVEWRVAMKPGRRRLLGEGVAEEAAEKRKGSVRAKVEHPFLYVKRHFGYAKVRYRGVAKNRQRIALLLGFSNLLIAGRYATG